MNDIKSSFANRAILKKGEEVVLTNLDPSLGRVMVGLGWDAPEKSEGAAVDLDASAFLLRPDGRVRRDTDFVFYNNLETENGAIKHLGDNTSGDGEGDDERIAISLDQLAFDIEKIVFTVTMHNAHERGQNFGIVKNAFIRIVNSETDVELARFDLTEDASDENAMVFGEIVRDGISWKFKAIGAGHNGGLYKLAREYGINVAPN